MFAHEKNSSGYSLAQNELSKMGRFDEKKKQIENFYRFFRLHIHIFVPSP